MLIKIFLLFFNVSLVWLESVTPLAQKVWRERCPKHALALNDCNWCRCGSNFKYECTARICDRVDMFGHFNDAITQMDVGIEGKGVWRTTNNLCEPGVHYRKNEILCVCNEDGQWPNPVCRDIFQILHVVEPTDYYKPNNQTCSANKLYQVGCNVCYCSSSEVINPDLCTKRNCNDEFVEPQKQMRTAIKSTKPVQVYAPCVRGKVYKIDCQTCICLPNNFLLCDNCTDINISKVISNNLLQLRPKDNSNNKNSLCSSAAPGKLHKNKCNICHCDKKDIVYCTVFKCLKFDGKISIPQLKYQEVDAPIDDNDCVPITKYKRDCNICHCFMLDGIKYFGCTVNKCRNDQQSQITINDCIEGTKYEKNCLICQCTSEKGLKREICTFNDKCKLEGGKLKKDTPTSLESMHGYCEPLHTYFLDCNKCKCLSNGQIVACTSKICSKTDRPIVVEFIPIIQKQNVCPKGHSYKVDCNVCYCLWNDNALCTTKQCKTNEMKLFGDY